jgi:endonuclease G, mitochondrial
MFSGDKASLKSPDRKDVSVEENVALARKIASAVKTLDQTQKDNRGKDDQRTRIRKTLIESDQSDPNGFERIIGESDLLSINFLHRGQRAAAAVCRIRVPGDGGGWMATGFLVGPRLLITNNHVLSSAAEAAQAECEFEYEHDVDSVMRPAVQFNLAPNEVFFTDMELDVTLVAVVPFSDGGVPIDRYGHLPLIPVSGKSANGEWVTIIQHPNGQAKQIAIQSNRIVELNHADAPGVDPGKVIHYTTDTEPGSSGAPVLNDQWQVVALHHRAIPSPATRFAADGQPLDDGDVEWLANEGVRVSANGMCASRRAWIRPACPNMGRCGAPDDPG